MKTVTIFENKDEQGLLLVLLFCWGLFCIFGPRYINNGSGKEDKFRAILKELPPPYAFQVIQADHVGLVEAKNYHDCLLPHPFHHPRSHVLALDLDVHTFSRKLEREGNVGQVGVLDMLANLSLYKT